MNKQVRILVVEDDEFFCQRLSEAFQARGFATEAATSIEHAIEVAKSNLPTHAVIDLRLGKQSGLVLLKALLSQSPEMQIVMLTGYGSISTALEAVQFGAKHYLTKPSDADSILQALGLGPNNSDDAQEPESSQSLPSLAQVEWEHIQRVLTDEDGNITRAAKLLGIPRRSLQRKLAKEPGKLV